MQIITVTSQKGGVGKTTTAVSLAADLAREGHCLLVDLDPQGHCAISFGFDPANDVYLWLSEEDSLGMRLFLTRKDGPWLARGNSRTKTVVLKKPLRDLITFPEWFNEAHPKFIVIDTPAYGVLQEAAIAAADHIVIPARAGLLDVDGVNATVALSKKLNPGVDFTILPTGVDGRYREHVTIIEQLEELAANPQINEARERLGYLEQLGEAFATVTQPAKPLVDVATNPVLELPNGGDSKLALKAMLSAYQYALQTIDEFEKLTGFLGHRKPLSDALQPMIEITEREIEQIQGYKVMTLR